MRAEKAKRAKEAERNRVVSDLYAIRERCHNLTGFVREAWRVLEPNAKLVWNWHLDALCLHLEAITAGTITRFLANVPPGSSKSLIVSVIWPAWEWTKPELRSLRYLTTSFNEIPVKRDTRKCRDLILSDWYRTLWPEVVLTRTGELSFANSDTGSREGVPFGSLTSQRGDRLIIDDPHSTKTAESEAERTETVRLFLEGAINRLNDQERSAIVVIMQRLHEADVSGAILSRDMGFDHLCLPMEFEADRRCRTRIGFVDPRTYDGELLDPARFPREVVERDFKPFAYAYAGQYQQRPAPRAGGLFKRDAFAIIERPVPCRSIVRRWDLASTEAGGDYTVGVKLGERTDGEGYLILDVQRFQKGPGEVRRLIMTTAEADVAQHGGSVRLIFPQDPAQAGKDQKFSYAKEFAAFAPRFERESGDKEVRADPFAAQVEIGRVSLVRATWNEPFINELASFPKAQHDDQVDAASGAFNALARRPGAMAISDGALARLGGR